MIATGSWSAYACPCGAEGRGAARRPLQMGTSSLQKGRIICLKACRGNGGWELLVREPTKGRTSSLCDG